MADNNVQNGGAAGSAGSTAGAATAPQAAPPPSPQPLDAVVDGWFNDSFIGTRLGNDTELWNLVYGAKENLKTRLAKR